MCSTRFGIRIGLSSKAEVAAVALSIKTGRPVKVNDSRCEDFVASDTRHAAYVKVKLDATQDGKFVALDLKELTNTSAKGCGECGSVCPTSAIVNAIADAIGKEITETPLTAERVFHLIHG